MRRDKANYKRAIRYKEKSRANEFSDSLNDSLLNKDMNRFWQFWRSKFSSKHPTVLFVDGLCDVKYTADRFASVFQSVCVPNCLQ